MGYVPPALAEPGAALGVVVRGKRQAAEVVACPSFPTAIIRKPDKEPDRMRFTKDHEWVEVDGDVATIGITAYAAEQLGDVVFVELPERRQGGEGRRRPGGGRERQGRLRRLRAGLRRGGRRSTPSCPTRPRRSTPCPRRDGWFAKVKLADPAEVDALMDRAAYEAFLATL